MPDSAKANQISTDRTGSAVESRSRPAPLELPDYLPARMLNEFVYCPRLFFYEWVEGVFAHSADTVATVSKAFFRDVSICKTLGKFPS